MKFSFVIPCYNFGKYLAEAINSALNQTYKNIEVIVVDDGSVDNTKEVASRFGDQITYIYQCNGGLSSARNTGIRHSTGDWILCLDADDWISPLYTKEAIKLITSHGNTDPNKIIVTSKVFATNEDMSKIIWTWDSTANASYEQICHVNCLHATSFFSKQLYNKVGPYDEDMKDGYEDWEFWIRMVKHGATIKVATSHEPFFKYRRHGVNMMYDTDRKRTRILEYMRQKHNTLIGVNACIVPVVPRD